MMPKIADETGRVIPGLFRDSTGAIIVNDSIALNKHIAAKNLEERVASTEKKLQEIHEMLGKMMHHLELNSGK